jgi:hypothetical protein
MATYCIRKDGNDYKEMLEVFGAENSAYVHNLWHLNNGNPLDFDQHGNPSVLFQELLEYTDGDRELAMKLKSTMFNTTFRDYFGDWLARDFTPDKHNVYENGEPQMDNILDDAVMAKAKPGHMDTRMQEAIDEYGEELIHDWNNPYAWDVEKELGTIEKFILHPGQKFKTKYLNGYSNEKAWELVHKAQALGAMARPIELHYSWTNPRAKWGVEIGWKTGRSAEGKATATGTKTTVNLAGREYKIVQEEKKYVDRLVTDIQSNEYNAMDLLRKLANTQRSAFGKTDGLMDTVNFILGNRRRNELVRVITEPTDTSGGNGYMAYRPYDNVIVLYLDKINNNPTLPGFVSAFTHEVIHSLTMRAITSPVDEIDAQFKTTMEQIFNDVQENDILSNKYALKNVNEFMAVFMTDPALGFDMKKYNSNGSTKSFLDRMIDAISMLLYRLTGYQIRKEKGSNLYEYVHSTITTYINSMTDYRKSDKYKEINRTLEAKAEVGERYKALQNSINPDDHLTIVKALNGLVYDKVKNPNGLFKIVATETEHTYQNVMTNQYLKATSDLLKEFGYTLPEEILNRMTPSQKEKAGEAPKIGNTIHLGFDELIKNGNKKVVTQEDLKQMAARILTQTGYQLSQDAINMLSSTLKEIKKRSTPRGTSITVLSEVFIADPELNVAGKIDLVIIDSDRRVHILDFKTKTKGFSLYGKKGSAKHSTKESYHLQLSIYKRLLEKFLNMEVVSMSIVMLQPTVNEKMIGSVALDTSYIKEGIDQFDKESGATEKVLGQKGKKFSWSRLQADMRAMRDYKTTTAFKLAEMRAGKKNPLNDIHDKTIKSLENKLEILRKRHVSEKTKSFGEFIEKVSQETNPAVALTAIIKYAYDATTALTKRYDKMVKSTDVFDLETLTEWRDYVTTYNTLDELLVLLNRDPSILGGNGILETLEELIGKKTGIIKIYERQAKIALASKLAPMHKKFQVTYKEELEKEYRIMKHRFDNRLKKDTAKLTAEELKLMEGGLTMKEYVDTKLEMDKTDLEKMAYEELLTELSVATADVSQAVRWIASIQDTRDPVIQAAVSLVNKATYDNRLEVLDKRLEVVQKLRKFETWKGRTVTMSERKLNEDIIEIEAEIQGVATKSKKDWVGSPTGYIVMPWYSTLDREEAAIRKENQNKTPKEARKYTMAWIDGNYYPDDMTEETKSAFRERYLLALQLHLSEAVANKKMTQSEVEVILNTEKNNGSLADLNEDKFNKEGALVQKALISDTAMDIALTWRSQNRRLYLRLNKKWVNPQWNKLLTTVGISTDIPIIDQMTELRKSEHPLAQYYIMIKDMAADADSNVPHAYRLGYHLPGIAKNKNERLREGQDMTTIMRSTLEMGLMHRVDDINYQTTELTDDFKNPKYFLPIQFTAKLPDEEQSYDLATIYMKYWSMANDHRNKQKILPALETTKYFIEHRLTERRDSAGNKIWSVVRGKRSKSEVDVSLEDSKRLAEQFNDWFQMYLYGNTVEKSEFKITDTLVADGQKWVDTLNGFVSLNLLALNSVQGTANIVIGDTMTLIEAIAGEYFGLKELAKATYLFWKWLPGMALDLGSRSPEHVGSLLIEEFDAMNVDAISEMDLSNANRVKASLQTSKLSIFQDGGEFWLRGRLLFAALFEKRAISKDGKDMGPMINFYYAEEGKLKIRESVDLEKSKWTKDDRLAFDSDFHARAYKVHGAYGTQEKVAAQRYMLGKLAYMYRKFVYPGIQRRYAKKHYDFRMEQNVEGNYRTTTKFFYELFKEMQGFQMAVLTENWAALSDHEKANIKRMMSEMAILLSVITLAGAAYSSWNDADEEGDKRFWAFIAYQMYRLKAELLFFSPKLDETWSLLRSPMASMSLMENIIKLSGQLFNPAEEYIRGPWKGHLKLTRDLIQFIPVYKQYYKLRDIQEQIQWFR